ncbi:hypothetical protein M3689_05450 [Alkalihalophilus marmarensis]|uniref:hypothetical protein n=1 Tax=Alkalihalophilus marmarensis TaxID=521377 RepID=UPI002040B5CE|nr:hypothetical protein [Alkalihalophilus marmarensis]MCM3488751.1 hypothetical protein [Alkalihalophilus marmarensis]
MKRKQVTFKLGELELYKIAEGKEDFSEYVKELIRRDNEVYTVEKKVYDSPKTKPFLKR